LCNGSGKCKKLNHKMDADKKKCHCRIEKPRVFICVNLRPFDSGLGLKCSSISLRSVVVEILPN
jgi:hypothetical protein